MYRLLAPGLTNVTNRLRYFSFYCWVVKTYETRHHSADLHKWRLFIRRAEAIYALASHLVDAPQSLGMAGGDWASRTKPSLLRDGAESSVNLIPHTDSPDTSGQYLKAKNGNLGQFYVASMLEVGMLAPFKSVPIVTEALGADLARSFGVSIGPAAQPLLEGMETGRIGRDGLLEIGAAAHPARIPSDSEELALLSGYLLGKNAEHDGSATRRRSSAWLRLELLNRGVGTKDEGPLRRALYARQAPDGSPINITGVTIDGWRAYQANEYGHIALECLLNGMVSVLGASSGVAPPGEIVAGVLDAALSPEEQSVGWETWARDVAAEVDEDELVSPILRSVGQGLAGDAALWAMAIRLVAKLWARWGANQENVAHQIAQAAGPSGRSLAGVLATGNRMSNRNLGEVLAEMLQRHIVSEHLAIAGQKLAGAGTFTYHFLLEDGEVSEGRLGAYTYTNPRLENLTRFMSDAGLHEDGQVTPAGKRFLDAYQAH